MASDERNEFVGGYFYLKAPHSCADIDGVELECAGVEIGREALLHTDRGAAPSDVSGHRKKVLHQDHLHLLVAGRLGQGLEVHLSIARNDAYDVPGPVPEKDKSLEHPLDRLAEAVCNVLSSKVVLVELVWDQVVRNLGLVKKAGGICLFGLLSHSASIRLSRFPGFPQEC